MNTQKGVQRHLDENARCDNNSQNNRSIAESYKVNEIIKINVLGELSCIRLNDFYGERKKAQPK